jgi:GAF domain-containing protein
MQMTTPIPADEEARQESLRTYEILDTQAEKVFDDITAVIAGICDTPIALLTFIDGNRQWIKANFGLPLRQTTRNASICAHAICRDELFVVPDTLRDARFADNPFVIGEPHIRFYAGMPLITPEGHALGALCVIDHSPRQLSEDQKAKLEALAQSAMLLLEIRLGRNGATALTGLGRSASPF